MKGLLEEELQGRRFLFRSAADLVAVRGAVDPRPLLELEDFKALRETSGATGGGGGLTVVGYVRGSVKRFLSLVTFRNDACSFFCPFPLFNPFRFFPFVLTHFSGEVTMSDTIKFTGTSYPNSYYTEQLSGCKLALSC